MFAGEGGGIHEYRFLLFLGLPDSNDASVCPGRGPFLEFFYFSGERDEHFTVVVGFVHTEKGGGESHLPSQVPNARAARLCTQPNRTSKKNLPPHYYYQTNLP